MPIEIMIALHGLKDTPVPTILVLGGISLLVLAFVKAGIKFVIDPSQRKPAIIFGTVLLGLGIGLYLIPEQQPSSTPIFTPTPTIMAADTPIAATTTLMKIPAPTSWPLEGAITTNDNNALCTIKVSDAYQPSSGNVKSLQFNITGQGGYCSWIIPLNGYDATSKQQITFRVRGDVGGEQYEVGIKDRKTLSGLEPKVLEIASISWTQVFISLRDGFKHQDLSSLENFSLNFKVGSGTIYVDQLIFIP